MPAIIISKKKHSSYKFRSLSNFSPFKNKGLIPICLPEIHKVIPNFPIVFTKNEKNISLCILASFKPDDNLFITKEGKWLGNYIPAIFRAVPFGFYSAENQDSKVLCFVDDYNCVLPEKKSSKEFLNLFDQKGEFSEAFKKQVHFVDTYYKSTIATHKLCEKLEDAGLINEWKLKLKSKDGENEVKGLYKIDESKFLTLDEKTLKSFFEQKILDIAYGQFFSMGNLEKLASLHSETFSDRTTVKESKSLREKVLEKQQKESQKEVDQLVRNLVADE